MNIKKNKKRLAQIRHAKRRALERFGVELSEEDYINLVKALQWGQFTPLPGRQSNRVSLYYIPLGDKTSVAVYDKHRKTIVTFMYQAADYIDTFGETYYESNGLLPRM